MVVCIIEHIKENAVKNASLFSAVTGLKTYWLDPKNESSSSGLMPCVFCNDFFRKDLSPSKCQNLLANAALHLPHSETSCICFCPSGLCHAVVPVFDKKQAVGILISEPIYCSDDCENALELIAERIGESHKQNIFSKAFAVWPYAKFSRAARLLTQMIYPNVSESIVNNFANQIKEAAKEDKISAIKHILDLALENFLAENGDDLLKIKSACIQFIFMLAEVSDDCLTGETKKWTSRFTFSLADAHSIGQLKTCLNLAEETLIQNLFQSSVLKRNLLIQKATSIIESQFQTRLTQNAIAKAVYLTPSYFSKVFKETVGCNFSQYLNQIRVEKAKELLANPLIDLDDIPAMVGYENRSYFGKVFKKLTETTPKRYRKGILP